MGLVTAALGCGSGDAQSVRERPGESGGTSGTGSGGSSGSGMIASGGTLVGPAGGGSAGQSSIGGEGGTGAVGGDALGGTAGAAMGGSSGTSGTGGAGNTGHRYVRFVALSEQAGNVWSAVAEFNLSTTGGQLLDRSAWTVTPDSEELDDQSAPATAAIDGLSDTFWHTGWEPTGEDAPLPHELVIDLGSSGGHGLLVPAPAGR
jgi:hypothetical protein